ncbi:hypothetical protein [Pareuzebyella sediminis]|uniref:hypothetical protein n=1 Tax=Pareuzebyella sediminis TaxID=2607998 RepID=UPI0011ED55E4|nr:hypothetical protein [Pareuzebyella sediminis]
MNYKGPICYTLFLTGDEKNRTIYQKMSEGKVANFTAPVTAKLTPKIYVLQHNGKPVYVGYASQSIGTRLNQGLKADGKKGYHGYKWKQADELKLMVFVFEQKLKGKKDNADKPYILFVEAVEAELVYKIRQETGKWPAFQNEIHFNNENLEKAKLVAAEIYRKINLS